MPSIEMPDLHTRRNLVTVATLARQYGELTESQVRAWVHNRDRNGLASAVVKPNQRRLYIDLDLFEAWLTDRTRQLSV